MKCLEKREIFAGTHALNDNHYLITSLQHVGFSNLILAILLPIIGLTIIIVFVYVYCRYRKINR